MKALKFLFNTAAVGSTAILLSALLVSGAGASVAGTTLSANNIIDAGLQGFEMC